ncbi:MAG: hypothetical protein WC551_08800 [Patescibacteria group bacterium]
MRNTAHADYLMDARRGELFSFLDRLAHVKDHAECFAKTMNTMLNDPGDEHNLTGAGLWTDVREVELVLDSLREHLNRVQERCTTLLRKLPAGGRHDAP